MGGNFLFSIIKLFIAIFLVPLISSMVLSFYGQVHIYPVSYQSSFFIGLSVFLFLFVFLYQFWRIYEFGQRGISSVFKFAAPYDNILALIVPFYLVLTLILFYITKNFFNNSNNDYVFMFFVGFFTAMHIILASQELQEKDSAAIKPSYYFGILFVIFFTILILVFGIDLIRGKFTFPRYYNETLRIAKDMYALFLKKILFLK